VVLFTLGVSLSRLDGAAPSGPLVTIDTAVDGAAPEGTRDDGSPYDAEHRPGIRIGDVVYRAPWMRSAGAQGSYSGYIQEKDVRYLAMLQVIAVRRDTAEVIWNRTYGLCESSGPGEYTCRARKGEDPAPAHLGQDLAALQDAGDGKPIVIAASHPDGGTFFSGRSWGHDPEFRFKLAAIGLPDDNDFLSDLFAAEAGEFSMIGVPGLARGRADVSVAKGRRGRMRGYLEFDPSTKRYDGFIPSARVPIDTRAAESCKEAACELTIGIGQSTAIGSVPNGSAGYVAAVYHPQTLDRLEPTRTFLTGGCAGDSTDCATAVAEMAATLESWNKGRDLLIVVTSVETPKQEPFPRPVSANVPQADWIRLGKAIAALGGTRHVFNKAASETNRTYSLVGRSNAGEGGGTETIQSPGGSEGRIRGALVPDGRSVFRLRNASSTDAPPQRLQQLVVQAPSAGGGWPDLVGSDAISRGGRHAAVLYVGSKASTLGADPRGAFWRQRIGVDPLATVESVKSEVGKVTMPEGPVAFTAADFAWAKSELLDELDLIEKTRRYLAALADPTKVATQRAWPDATKLANSLSAQLKEIDEKAEISFDAFGIVQALLEFAGAPIGSSRHGLKAFLEVLAGLVETSKVLYEAKYSDPSVNLTITADELATRLSDEADARAKAFLRLGDVLVSDYAKLSEVGKWAFCNPDGGCEPGYEEYAVTPEYVERAATMASRALHRTLYEHLVPLAFPVWDTSLATAPNDPQKNFNCAPFSGAPANGWGLDAPPHFGAASQSLDELDPGDHVPTDQAYDDRTRWRTFLMVHHKGSTYGWPEQEVLDRMFAPVSDEVWNFDADSDGLGDEGGLGISPQNLMRRAWMNGGATRYEDNSGGFCTWSYHYGPFSGNFFVEPPPR
jgi:hypothetical protein